MVSGLWDWARPKSCPSHSPSLPLAEDLEPHRKHISTLHFFDNEVPHCRSEKVAGLVTDQTRQRDRAIVSPEEIVEHFRLPGGIQSKHRSVRVRTSELSRAKQVSGRIFYQTPVRNRPVTACESM